MLLNFISDPQENLLWLFGSRAYNEEQFKRSRERKVHSLLPQSGITPHSTTLFDEQELDQLNSNIPERGIKPHYALDQLINILYRR